MSAPVIIGAGLAGLIAGHIFPGARLFELEPQPRALHKALLRFRSDAVSLVTGIPFRKVRVHKAIWSGGRFCPPDMALANRYSLKVTGKALSRSIWDVSSVDRFIAPEDFYVRLVEQMGARIQWGVDWLRNGGSHEHVAISTAPLPATCTALMPELELPLFKALPIFVRRYRIADCDLHQSVYLPDRSTSTYRVSITGDLMIVESMNEPDAIGAAEALHMLGMENRPCMAMEANTRQSYGKIAPIDDLVRKELIHRLSMEANVYSLGRFATWRNILLDDVVEDARRIQRMMDQQDAYSKRLTSIS